VKGFEVLFLGAGVLVAVFVVLVRMPWPSPGGGGEPLPAPREVPDPNHVTIEGVSTVRCADSGSFVREALDGHNVALFMPCVERESTRFGPGLPKLLGTLKSAILERELGVGYSTYSPLQGRIELLCSRCWSRDDKTPHPMQTYHNGDFCPWCGGQGVLYLYRGRPIRKRSPSKEDSHAEHASGPAPGAVCNQCGGPAFGQQSDAVRRARRRLADRNVEIPPVVCYACLRKLLGRP
jgi:hypothetical protein